MIFREIFMVVILLFILKELLVCNMNMKNLGSVWLLFSRTVLENKKKKKHVWGKGCVFLFFVFSVFSKTTFFENNKKMFSLFLHCSKNRLFSLFSFPSFCVFLAAFCFSTKVSSTQPPHPTCKPFLLP